MLPELDVLVADQAEVVQEVHGGTQAEKTMAEPASTSSEEDGEMTAELASSSSKEDGETMAEPASISSKEDWETRVQLACNGRKEDENTGSKPEMGVQPASTHDANTKQTEDVGVQCDRYPCGEGVNESWPWFDSSRPSGVPHYRLKIIDVDSTWGGCISPMAQIP